MEVHLGALPGNYEFGESFSDVLSYNHFGTPTIPPRPVLRIAAEKTIEKLSSSEGMVKSIVEAFLGNLLKNPGDAKKLEREFLRKIGSQSIAEAKRIIDNITDLQENAPATVAKKHFNQPLYETGELEKHIGYEIID
jgi:hypothetical protein